MKTRDKIKEACLELFVKFGMEGTSTKMILENSGVSNGSLFNHFPNKEEIVKEIYVDLKTEQKDYYEKHLDTNKATRPFMFDYWKIHIGWALDNKLKSDFLEMYATSAVIKNSVGTSIFTMFKFLLDRISLALENQEVVSHSTIYFILHFMNTTKSVALYLQADMVKDKDTFIETEFKQYWRSIANF